MSSSPWPASVACVKRSAIAAAIGQVGAVALGRLGHQPRVLGRQRQRERGRELLVEHELGLHAEVGQVQRAALERLRGPTSGSTPSAWANAIVSAVPWVTARTQG